jgi:GntR family transcriptional repressor for pyruvate dehydrogenase complex
MDVVPAAVQPMFAPVDRRTLAEEVRTRLFEAVRGGALAPGSPIPSERSLCEDFGVARTSVREAIQGLVSLGVLERRGNRTVVAERLPEILPSVDGNSHARGLKVRELFEVREAMELPIAKLVVERASDEEIEEIVRLVCNFRPTMDVEEFRRLDRAFHWALARACGNELLTELYGKVLDRLFQSSDFAEPLTARVNSRAVRVIVRDSCSAHRAIADALQKRDADAVVAAVEHHLDQVENQLVDRLI